jgi:hypothetical protein
VAGSISGSMLAEVRRRFILAVVGRRDRDGGGILDRSYKDQHQDGPGAGVAHRPQLGRRRF